MKKNLFAAEPRTEQAEAREVREPQARRLSAPDYTASPCGLPDHIVAFILGFVAGFAVLYILYKFIPAAVLGGASLAGGKGSYFGSIAGAMILSLIVGLLIFWGISSYYQNLVQGIILILALSVGFFTEFFKQKRERAQAVAGKEAN